MARDRSPSPVTTHDAAVLWAELLPPAFALLMFCREFAKPKEERDPFYAWLFTAAILPLTVHTVAKIPHRHAWGPMRP